MRNAVTVQDSTSHLLRGAYESIWYAKCRFYAGMWLDRHGESRGQEVRCVPLSQEREVNDDEKA